MNARRTFRVVSWTTAVALALAGSAFAAERGDRQLIATGGGDPYLFLLLDTSGSMALRPACTAANRAAGICDYDCNAHGCPGPKNGDDPNSKFYLAKKALYTVMTDPDLDSPIRWGFGSLNQDTLAVAVKHWLYEVESVTVTNGSATPDVPAVGWQEVFGPQTGGSGSTAFDMTCERNASGNSNNAALYETGCYMTSQDAPSVSTTDRWSLEKLRRLPKGGTFGSTSTSYFMSSANGNTYYRITYAGGSAILYQDTPEFDVTVTIESCGKNDVNGTANGCTPGFTFVSTKTIHYTRVDSGGNPDPELGEFLWWEGNLSKDTSNNSIYAYDAYFGGSDDGEDDATLTPSGIDAMGTYATKTCRGYEPSGDFWGQNATAVPNENDPYGGYNLRYTYDEVPYSTNALGQYTFTSGIAADNLWRFEYGDFIPFHWDTSISDHKDEVLKRLNPKHPTVDDDSFAQAPFFADSYQSGEAFLRLAIEDDGTTADVNEVQKPLIATGDSPFSAWFSMFRYWYSGCGDPGQCVDTAGWSDIAAQHDPNFACSPKYVMLISDGIETCDAHTQQGSTNDYADFPDDYPSDFDGTTSHCRYRASLRAQEDINNIAIGFGVDHNNSDIQCANTNDYYADNYDELVLLLEQLLGEIIESATAFASAAVPTVQANILDKVYLSSFIPLADAAVWPGRLDTFLKPLPLDADNLPDRSVVCGNTLESECFAWDGGDSQLGWNTAGVAEAGYVPTGLLLQAPRTDEIDLVDHDNASLQIGDGEEQRRVYFGLPSTSSDLNRRQLFQFPVDSGGTVDPAQLANLEYAWNLSPGAMTDDERLDVVDDIIAFTLEEKQGTIDDGGLAPQHIQYVMGDIFHSNPLVLNPPADFEFFTEDLYWNSELCGDDLDTTRDRGPQISYSWYSNKNLCRRVTTFVGSNDGQIHAFDGGLFSDATDPDCKLPLPENAPDHDNQADTDGTNGKYDFGTGREIFSFIPETMMPLVKELSEIVELSTEYGPDGSPRAADVFVDPYVEPNGTPVCRDRVWRTLLFQNYREGGPGFVALDVTQPDEIATAPTEDNVPAPLTGTLGYVPSCSSGDPDKCNTFCRSESGQEDAECAALAYPALRFEFRDLDGSLAPADDDVNGYADLAESWSRPFIARMSVCTGACDTDAEPEDRFVAIFGGGIDEYPTNDSSEVYGNWLYMVDVETGKAIYKRGGTGTSSEIVGAVPADIGGVDDDSDGYVDTLYFGTTAGFLYKVDLTLATGGEGPYELDETTGLIQDPSGETGRFDPFQVFSTGGRPIYLEVGAVYVPKRRANAVLFGTGNRWDLWDDEDTIGGRFYTLLDEGWADTDLNGVVNANCTPACAGVLTEANYPGLDPDSTAATEDYLYGSGTLEPGWYFTLDNNEKLITEPFTLSGITFFTIFDPLLVENNDGLCTFSGESKIFTVNTVTTEGYAIAVGATERTRYFTAPTFTTQPFVELSATKNPASSSTQRDADEWTDELTRIYQELKRLFPSGSRFANYTLDIKTVRSDTGIVFIAPVPVAIEPHNWKEF